MSLLVAEAQATWADMPNVLSCHISVTCPEPQTSATCLVFTLGGLLAVNVEARGWDIPGGHVEAGETALQAVLREVKEEAGLSLREDEVALYGYTKLELSCEKPENYKYPYPTTHQPIYVAHVDTLRTRGLQTEVKDEIIDVRVLSFTEAMNVFKDRSWYPVLRYMLGFEL